MRKILFLICFFVLYSCADNSRNSNEKSIIEDTFSVKEYSTSSFVEEKFLEFYDLKILLKNKPEFREAITKRLANFKIDSNTILDLDKNDKIKNLKIIEPDPININPYNRIKMIFEIHNKTISKKDSLIAIIIEKENYLNNEKIAYKKVKFLRFTE